MTGEDRSCIHGRLAGLDAIDKFSWAALTRVAGSLDLKTKAGKCPRCGEAVVLPVTHSSRVAVRA
jgi:hypothetical protein